MDNLSLREASERIDELLDELGQSAPPAVMERVEELLRCVMALYGAGLDRVLELADDSAGEDSCAGSPTTRWSATCWSCTTCTPTTSTPACRPPSTGSGPTSARTPAVSRCSASTSEGVVHLQLEGSCDGCPSSALTVKSAIEDAILVAAPDVVAVEAEGMVEPGPALLQIQPFRLATRRAGRRRGLAAPRARRTAAHAGPGDVLGDATARGRQPRRHPGRLPRPVPGLRCRALGAGRSRRTC